MREAELGSTILALSRQLAPDDSSVTKSVTARQRRGPPAGPELSFDFQASQFEKKFQTGMFENSGFRCDTHLPNVERLPRCQKREKYYKDLRCCGLVVALHTADRGRGRLKQGPAVNH